MDRSGLLKEGRPERLFTGFPMRRNAAATGRLKEPSDSRA
jgi:hypothetical protein